MFITLITVALTHFEIVYIWVKSMFHLKWYYLNYPKNILSSFKRMQHHDIKIQ